MNAALAEAAPGAYYDSALQTRAIRLLPADYVATDQPVALVTLLGSCVAACLYDPALAGFGESGGLFSQQASPGFIELWSLQSRMAYKVRQRARGTNEHEQ